MIRASVAIVAAACLIAQSGCSLLAGRRTTATTTLDVGWGVFGALTLPLVKCEIEGGDNEDGCLAPIGVSLFVGIPVLLGFALAASTEVGEEDDPYSAASSTPDPAPATEAPPPAWDLPVRATDPLTLQIARQARTAAWTQQCTAARAAMDRIAARDAEYHIAMLAAGAPAPCP